MEFLKIVVASAIPLYCSGIEKELLVIFKGFSIFKAFNPDEILNLLKTETIDLILIDIEFKNVDSGTFIKFLKNNYINTKIIAVSNYTDRNTVSNIIEAGAMACINKNIDLSKFHDVVKNVLEGKLYISLELNETIINVQRLDKNIHKSDLLTPREVEILILLCHQLSSKQIGIKLNLSVRTIESHRAKINAKTMSKNLIGLIFYAIEKKYFLPDNFNSQSPTLSGMK